MKQQNLPDSLTKTLIESDISSVAKEISEVALDSMLEEGVFRDIPIVSTVFGVGKTAANVKDYLFLKKVPHFIQRLDDTTLGERKKMISEIDTTEEYRVRVGEKLLYIIDKADDHQTAEAIGILFSAFLKNKISYDDFLKSSTIVNVVFWDDLKSFIKSDDTFMHLEKVSELMGTGLYGIEADPVEVSVDDQDDYKLLREGYGPKYKTEIEGGQLWGRVTPIGELLRSVLKNEV
jgi:hypothetical protein